MERTELMYIGTSVVTALTFVAVKFFLRKRHKKRENQDFPSQEQHNFIKTLDVPEPAELLPPEPPFVADVVIEEVSCDVTDSSPMNDEKAILPLAIPVEELIQLREEYPLESAVSATSSEPNCLSTEKEELIQKLEADLELSKRRNEDQEHHLAYMRLEIARLQKEVQRAIQYPQGSVTIQIVPVSQDINFNSKYQWNFTTQKESGANDLLIITPASDWEGYFKSDITIPPASGWLLNTADLSIDNTTFYSDESDPLTTDVLSGDKIAALDDQPFFKPSIHVEPDENGGVYFHRSEVSQQQQQGEVIEDFIVIPETADEE